MIAWSSRYETGIRTIDRQHKQIVDIINELYSLEKGKEQKVMNDVFARLLKYFQTPFREEEALMVENGYQGFPLQKSEHDAFIDTIFGYQKEFLKGRPLVTINVFNAVWDWFAHHIMKIDMQFQPFFAQKGVK